MEFGEWEIAMLLVALFGICVVAFAFYLIYVCYLKRFRSYRYENGIPDVAIFRGSRLGSAGMKHFSAAPFRASQISISSTDRNRPGANVKRPHTFPLTSSGRPLEAPEIRINPA